MSTTTFTCDQAIFTSIRTPMGEGYRIVASSRGVRPEEKQAITRYSPSHDALCAPASAARALGEAVGAAFYPLPTGRLCVAVSCFAGSEHTGRGGQRVYTHNVLLERSELPRCGYNPFHILRAMVRGRITTPQLKPPPQLQALELSVITSVDDTDRVALNPTLSSACRCRVLQQLLDGRTLVVKLDGEWLESMEAWLMGVPGPMRTDFSFGAGLRFSAGRCHQLQLLSDHDGTLKRRAAGQPLEYVDPASGDELPTRSSAWLSFVEHHWHTGDTHTLAHRTSRPFADTGLEARERVGRLYRLIDEIPKIDAHALLGQVAERMDERTTGVEQEIAAEFVTAGLSSLVERFARNSWAELAPYWPSVVSLWRRGDQGSALAQPLIDRMLQSAMEAHPITAAEAALDVARDISPAARELGHPALLDNVLNRLAEWATEVPDGEVETLLQVCDRWRLIRPRVPIVDRIYRLCTALVLGAAYLGQPLA